MAEQTGIYDLITNKWDKERYLEQGYTPSLSYYFHPGGMIMRRILFVKLNGTNIDQCKDTLEQNNLMVSIVISRNKDSADDKNSKEIIFYNLKKPVMNSEKQAQELFGDYGFMDDYNTFPCTIILNQDMNSVQIGED